MIIAVLLAAPLPCAAAEKADETVWSEDGPERDNKSLEPQPQRVEHIMNRLAETDPEKAKELEKLRKEDPEKFKAEIREIIREQFSRRLRNHAEQKPGRRFQHGMDMPGMEPRGPGEFGMGMEQMYDRHAEYLEWLGKNYPEEADKLTALKSKNPELYMKELRLSYRKYGRIAEAAKENPQLAEVLKKDFELGKAQNELLKKIKAATNDNEKKELTQKLEGTLGQRFDLIMERKQIEYEHLRKKLERLKEEVQQSEGQVEKWKQLKGNIVKERLDKLLKQSEEFTWD
jgi:hypothetical protein